MESGNREGLREGCSGFGVNKIGLQSQITRLGSTSPASRRKVLTAAARS
jgi:hypothetical protein